MSNQCYEKITQGLVDLIEAGNLPPWQKPWSGSGMTMPLRACGKPYQGVNVVSLWVSAMAQGFASPYWLTFKQARDLGGNVTKGQKSTTVCYYSTFDKKTEGDAGSEDEGETKRIAFLKSYAVFNAEQCENLPEEFYPEREEPDAKAQFSRNAEIDAYVATLGADIKSIDDARAYYMPSKDYINIPSMLDFENSERYYGVLFHELTHWTGAKSRLDREMSTVHGSKDYAKEELVAELGAAFLCAAFGFGDVTREDHAAYLQNWLSALKSDARFIFKASSAAQKAVNYLNELHSTAAQGKAVAA